MTGVHRRRCQGEVRAVTDRRSGDEGDGEKAPGTEDRLGVGSTLRVVAVLYK
jgi:hypothetical protein